MVEPGQGDREGQQHQHTSCTSKLPDTADLDVMMLKILVWE